MKSTFLILFISLSLSGISQEMWDNLYATLHTSSLHLFHDSEFEKMEVESFRSSKKHGLVMETDATYRKGKINAEKIRYSIKYTEYYILEDRKRSIGIYHMADDRLFDRYERTDFNRRNIRKWTYKHHFDYKEEVLETETIRTIEYLSEGSAEVDTAHYLDSSKYEVVKEGNLVKQHPVDDESVYTSFVVENKRLVKRTNHFLGFDEIYDYHYNGQGLLIKIENNLSDTEGRNIYTYTDIKYGANGLMSEAQFFDESHALLEKRVFSYK